MKPAIIQLPDVYRGCIYPAIYLFWKDKQGDPFNLNGWVPLCYAKDFSFNAHVTNPESGETRMVINQHLTKELRLGRQAWDFIWVTGPFVYPPILSGVVTVRDPLSSTEPPPADDTAPDGPVTP